MHLFRTIQLAVLLVVFTVTNSAFAQDRFTLSGGYGYYEAINAGANWHYSEKSSVGIYLGTNFGLDDKNVWVMGFDYSHIYLKPLFWKLRPGFSFQPQYWTQDDDNYRFANITLLMHAVLQYPVSETFQINLEGGGALNYATETERKQNTTAGFPRRWNGSFAVGIVYQLNQTKSE
jgi:opacity protein-like surface antigen